MKRIWIIVPLLFAGIGCKQNQSISPPPSSVEKSPRNNIQLKSEYDDKDLKTRMASFSKAMLQKDSAAFLQHLSRTAPWKTVATLEEPWTRQAITFQETEDGLKPGGDYRGFLFGEDDLDSLRDYFVNKTSWIEKEKLLFVPAHRADEDPPRVFIRWRKEDSKFVIAEIGLPLG